jgi:hypothetical protein
MMNLCRTMPGGTKGSTAIMHIRGKVLTPLVVGAFVAASMFTSPAVARPQQGQKSQAKPKELTKVQKLELQASVNSVEAVRRGTPAPSGYKMTLQTDSMKGYNSKTYVAFTAFVDPEGATPKPVTCYLRVVAKANDEVPEAKIDPKDPKAAEKAKAEEKANADAKKAGPPPYAWEDMFFTDIKSVDAGKPLRLARSFTVSPGEYNVYLSIRDTSDLKAKDKDVLAAKSGVVKQLVVVPDYWNNELNTSSIIVTDTVTNLTAPLAPEEQPAHPYAFGQAELKPLQEPKLSKNAELTAWFFVYNPAADANRKPNVLIEYKFYQKVASAEKGEKYFNATKPVELNAQTLPPQFDMAAGHQLPGGLAVPLASFPEGVYRLEIKVSDKISGKSITKDVTFNVTP